MNKIIVFGCQEIAVGIIRFLNDLPDVEIPLVVTYELPLDKVYGYSSVSDEARKMNLNLRMPKRITAELVQEINEINPDLVNTINSFKANAEAVTARNANSILKVKKAKNPELGFVADPEEIDIDKLNHILNDNKVPVIAPMGLGENDQVYNINADTAAGTIAIKVKAKRLLLMTDVPGVKDKNGDYISKLTVAEAQALIDNETITGGMIPKIQTCISAINNGVGGVVIIDGTKPHAVLHELFTDEGAGTLIVK